MLRVCVSREIHDANNNSTARRPHAHTPPLPAPQSLTARPQLPPLAQPNTNTNTRSQDQRSPTAPGPRPPGPRSNRPVKLVGATE